jgi:hypothetical protein
MVAASACVGAASTRTSRDCSVVPFHEEIAMTIAQIQKIAAEAVANALRLTQTQDAPAPAKKAGGDLQAKRLAALEKARAAKKAKAQAKPAAVVAEPVQKPAKAKKSRPAWSVKDHVTKKGVKGQIVQIGPLTAWLPAGDNARKAELFAAINGVIRSDEIRKVAAQIR